MTLPIERVERVVDDEVVPPPDPPPRSPRPRAPRRPPADGFDEAQPVPRVPTAAYLRGGQAPPDQTADRLRRHPRRIGGHPGHLAQGARGLMQLMPATGERFGVRKDQLTEPGAHLEAGITYLKWLADRFQTT